MSQYERVGAPEVRAGLLSGDPILLVCAYPDDAKFRLAPLEGAIPFSEYARKKDTLPHDLRIVFY